MAKATEKATLEVGGQVDFSNIEKGIAKLDAKLNQMSKSQKGLNTETSKSQKGLMDFAKGAQAAVAALAASQVVKFTVEMVKLDAAVDATTNRLDFMTQGHADDYVRSIAEASGYLVSEQDALEVSLKLVGLQLVENEQQAADLTTKIAVLGQTFKGVDAGQAADEFALLMANMSIPRLDSFGISASKVKSRIDELMNSTSGMTKEAAFQQAVMEELDAAYNRIGGQAAGTASDIAVLESAFADLKVAAAGLAGDTFAEPAHRLAELTKIFRDMKAAQKSFPLEAAKVEESFEGWADAMANAGLANKGVVRAIHEGGTAATAVAKEIKELENQYIGLKVAAMEAEGVDFGQRLHNMGYAGGEAAIGIEETTEAIEEQTITVEDAEQAQRAYTEALRNQLRRQESIAGITADLVGQFDTLGRTFYSVVPANNDAAIAAERYGENIEDLRATAGQLAQDIQYLGDGEGALQAKLDETNAVIAQQEAAMASASSQAGDLRTAYTITQLTQEQLNLVGESFMDLLSATGNELLMTGKGYDDYRLKMQLATEEQIRMEHGQQLLMEALSAGRVSVEQAGDVYTAYVTGQVADIEQAIATQEAHNAALAQVPGLMEKMGEVGLGDIFAEAEEPTQTITDQFGAMSESVSQMAEMAPVAFEQLAELAPGVNEAMTPLQLSMTQIAGALTGMITTAPNWASAMNESFAALASEGSGVWQGTSLISGLYSDWLYLQQNPRLSLEAIVSITSTGSLPGAAGGADFIATKPTLLPVGELGLPERVTVKPMYNTAGIPPYNPSKGIGFAAGGTLTYPGSGGRAVINIGAINVSGVQSVRDIARELANGVLQRELKAAGYEIGRIA